MNSFVSVYKEEAAHRWEGAEALSAHPVFAFVLFALLVLSLFFGLACWLFATQLTLYFSALEWAALKLAIEKRKPFLIVDLPPAIATTYTSWAQHFLWSIFASTKHG